MVFSLVLSGGGARGAYEAGVISYLFGEFFPKKGIEPPFSIFCGTSVGAIHTVFIPSYIDNLEKNIRILEALWKNIKMQDISISLKRVLKLPFWQRLPPEERGLFNTKFITNIISGGINWDLLHRNVIKKEFTVAVFATHIGSGLSVMFVESPKIFPEWKDPFMSKFHVLLRPEHILASASIPFVFLPQQIDGDWYCDGGIRLNTPLSPALRLGADKIFTVALRYQGGEPEEKIKRMRIETYPNPLFLVGKIMNALLMDKIVYDIQRTEIINSLVELGESFFKDFYRVEEEMEKIRGYKLKKVDVLVVYPSEDIGKIAPTIARKNMKKYRGLEKLFIKFLSSFGLEVESDVLSYLFFDSDYLSTLFELGIKDAKNMGGEMERFFKK